MVSEDFDRSVRSAWILCTDGWIASKLESSDARTDGGVVAPALLLSPKAQSAWVASYKAGSAAACLQPLARARHFGVFMIAVQIFAQFLQMVFALCMTTPELSAAEARSVARRMKRRFEERGEEDKR